MKHWILISIFITLFISQELAAQDSTFRTGKFYRISLRMMGKTKNIGMGFLAWMNDSTLYYSRNKVEFSNMGLQEYFLDTLSYAHIKSVSLFTGSPSATVLYPAAGGFVTGAIIGFAMGNDPPDDIFYESAAEKALILGTLGFAAGAIVGGFITLAQHHYFNIKGNKDKFQELVKFIRAREFPEMK
jgi:hypothetical protein